MLALALLVALTSAVSAPSSSARGAALVPITQRGIAAVVLDYAPTTTSSRYALSTDQTDRPGTLGTDFRYHADGESDGDLLRTGIAPTKTDFACPSDSHCMELDRGQPEPVFLFWEKVLPESDPGLVAVVANHDGEQTIALYAGPPITANPLTLDLEIPVDVLFAIVTDPRLRLQTAQEVVDAGVALTGWTGGEPDPYAYLRVPQTDIGQVNGWLFELRGLTHYSGIVPSPWKDDFGPDTIGGRAMRSGVTTLDPTTVDVLATSQPPEWLAANPCARRFAGHCLRQGTLRGPLLLMWRPATATSNGVIWAAQVRTRETVAFRFVGGPVPSRLDEVKAAIRWRGAVRPSLTSRRLGLMTYKAVLDFELPAAR